MRLVIAFVLLATLCLAGDLPTLTDAQRLQVQDARIVVLTAENIELKIAKQCAAGVKELEEKTKAAQALLNNLIASLRPKECIDCQLNTKLVWERPEVEATDHSPAGLPLESVAR